MKTNSVYRQPVLFVSWTSPAEATGTDDGSTQRLRAFGESLNSVDAVVVASTHVPRSDADRPAFIVNGTARPSLIHDSADAPENRESMRYPAYGYPDLAMRIAGRLISAGIGVRLDSERAWEHQVWMPLREVFPKGDVPVVEISAAADLASETLLRAGEALSFLRERGILLMAVSDGATGGGSDPIFFTVGAVGSGDRVLQLHPNITVGGSETSLARVA